MNPYGAPWFLGCEHALMKWPDRQQQVTEISDD